MVVCTPLSLRDCCATARDRCVQQRTHNFRRVVELCLGTCHAGKAPSRTLRWSPKQPCHTMWVNFNEEVGGESM